MTPHKTASNENTLKRHEGCLMYFTFEADEHGEPEDASEPVTSCNRHRRAALTKVTDTVTSGWVRCGAFNHSLVAIEKSVDLH